MARGDRQRQAQRGRAGRCQHQHDGLGPVGNRAERIEGQRRQPPEAGQMVLAALPVPQRHSGQDLLRDRSRTHGCLPCAHPRRCCPVLAVCNGPFHKIPAGRYAARAKNASISPRQASPGSHHVAGIARRVVAARLGQITMLGEPASAWHRPPASKDGRSVFPYAYVFLGL